MKLENDVSKLNKLKSWSRNLAMVSIGSGVLGMTIQMVTTMVVGNPSAAFQPDTSLLMMGTLATVSVGAFMARKCINSSMRRAEVAAASIQDPALSSQGKNGFGKNLSREFKSAKPAPAKAGPGQVFVPGAPTV